MLGSPPSLRSRFSTTHTAMVEPSRQMPTISAGGFDTFISSPAALSHLLYRQHRHTVAAKPAGSKRAAEKNGRALRLSISKRLGHSHQAPTFSPSPHASLFDFTTIISSLSATFAAQLGIASCESLATTITLATRSAPRRLEGILLFMKHRIG